MKTLKIFKLISITFLSIFLASCSDDDSDSPATEQTSKISIKMVDAPGDFEHVYVDVQDVMVKVNGDVNSDAGWVSLGAENTGVVDLLELTGGVSLELANDYEVPSGTLNQIRLILGENNTVVIDGTTYDLNTPSAQQSGLKINVNTTLEPNYNYTFVLDFDANQSIVFAPDVSNINLKPVINASIEAETGVISGLVTDFDTLGSQVMIEATNGVDTFTTYANETGNFVLAALPEGNYTVTLSVETSLGLADIVFTDVTVEAGQTVTLDSILFE